MGFGGRGADGVDMDLGPEPADDRFVLCLHLRSGDVQRTPYRSYEEARYVADLFRAAGNSVEPPEDAPFIYVFPPHEDVTAVAIVRG